jgi:formylglycine-generating enzyme required for sulfatase activity
MNLGRRAILAASILWAFYVAAASLHAAATSRPAPLGASPARFERYTEEVPRYLIKLEFVPVKGGSFTMAPLNARGEAKQVEVKDFWMCAIELPWEAFEPWLDVRWMSEDEHKAWAAQPSQVRMPPRMGLDNPDRGFGRHKHPVISVTRASAEAYCKWLSQRTGHAYRLPTEAEFEWGLGSGGVDWGNAEAIERAAWCRENSADDDLSEHRTHPVGTRAANKLGIHDLLGNVAEHVTPLDDAPMVVRGGSFKTAAARFAPAFRQPYSPRWQDRDANQPKSRAWLTDGEFIGFRVVRSRQEKP